MSMKNVPVVGKAHTAESARITKTAYVTLLLVFAAGYGGVHAAGADAKGKNPVVKPAGPVKIVLATSTKGGGFELYGTTVAAIMNEVNPRLNVIALPSRGSRENLALLEEGKADLGLVEGNAFFEARSGRKRPSTGLKILLAMYPNPGMFVVRGDSGHRTIADLKGKKIAFGTPASGLVLLAKDVLDGMGLDMGRDFQAVYLEKAADGPRLLLEGKVEAFWGAGIGWPGFKKVADSAAGGRFIVPGPDQVTRIRAKHPFLRPMTVPAGTYKGQKKAIHSLGLWSFILVRPDLSEETVYELAKTLHRSETMLAKRLPQGRYSTLSNTAKEAPNRELIHRGVLRYMKERGLAR